MIGFLVVHLDVGLVEGHTGRSLTFFQVEGPYPHEHLHGVPCTRLNHQNIMACIMVLSAYE